MSAILIAILAVAAISIALYPIFEVDRRRPRAAVTIDPNLENLLSAREATYSAIKDLETDHAMGKLSDTDYGIPVSYDALQEGDLVFFHTTRPGISHVGVYMGNGKFVHASSARDEVTIDRIDQGYYKERFIKALRLNFLK